MVILNEILIGTFLCVAISQIPGPTQAIPSCPPPEDLLDAYYTLTPAMTDKFEPQDDIDAKAIQDSDKSYTTVAGIFTQREKTRRYSINVKTADYSEDKKTRWLSIPHEIAVDLFEDCCICLVEKESAILANYLYIFLAYQEKEWIAIAMVLTKDIRDMINIFDGSLGSKFDDNWTDPNDPIASLMKNWAKQSREPLETGELNHDNVVKDANTLNTEYNNGGWKTTRIQLEHILFHKSIKDSRGVILEFEKLNNNKPIEDMLRTCGLDETIATIYRIFAQYIKNKSKFIAEILLKHSDGSTDYWFAWNMCLAVIHPQEWPAIDEAFKQCNKGISLTQFITGRDIDKVQAEMMAMIIDPSFKPTQFQPAPGNLYAPHQFHPPNQLILEVDFGV